MGARGGQNGNHPWIAPAPHRRWRPHPPPPHIPTYCRAHYPKLAKICQMRSKGVKVGEMGEKLSTAVKLQAQGGGAGAWNGRIPRCSLGSPSPPASPTAFHIQMSPKHCCCKLTSPHNSQTKHLDSICMTCPQNWLQELAMHGKTGLYHLKSGAHSIFPSSFIDMHNMWSSSHPCIRYCQQREISIIFFGDLSRLARTPRPTCFISSYLEDFLCSI